MASATGSQKQHLLFEQPLAQSIVVMSLSAMMRIGFVYPRVFSEWLPPALLPQAQQPQCGWRLEDHDRLQRHDFAALALSVTPTPEPILATQKLPSKNRSERSSPPLPCKSLAKPCSTAPIRLALLQA